MAKIGRNNLCPCGNGKKYKTCCIDKGTFLREDNNQQIDDLMQGGYDDIREENIASGCYKWLKVWDYLKVKFTSEMRKSEDAEEVFSGLQNISNWSQDFETELWNGAIEDEQLHHERIKYCDEFCSYFQESSELTMVNMQRAKAESLYAIGETGKGEIIYQKIIEEYPNNVWGYIGWGDVYMFGMKKPNVPIDFVRAKSIYEIGLDKEMEDKDILVNRLNDLNSGDLSDAEAGKIK